MDGVRRWREVGDGDHPGREAFAHEDHPEDFAASARPFLAATLM